MIFNKENIANYLQNDAELIKADATALQLFVEQNPYSGLLQLVYCKYLHLHNDYKLEQQLEKCALVVADRNKVYEILFKKELQQKIVKQTTKEEGIKVLKEEEQIISSPLLLEKEVRTDEVVQAQKENKQAEKQQKTFDELEQNILNEAINSSIQIDINDYAANEDSLIDKEATEEIEDKKNKIEKERSFVNWFDKPSYKKEVKNDSSIVNNFLKDAKTKSKISSSVVSPSEMAKMSLVANTQFVTETLATIYVKQGQIDKAIEIYEQLSLKNPEKKTFFASRIRFLKDKQQYNK